VLAAVVASIPSPSSGAIHLGSFQVRAYGLMIALGVIAAVWLAGRRLEEKGVGTRDDMAAVAMWAVPAGIVGARLYHVITDNQKFRDDPLRIVRVWEGGLGIWGGVAAGVAVGLWACRRRGIPLGGALAAATPALPLAQAIGRLGNWWNQELFGGPTSLPWGLEIDPDKRPPGYGGVSTFHPTFLYELVWDLALVALLLAVDRRLHPKPGRLFALYVAVYTFGRFWIERLRIDEANTILGLRVNEWVSALVFAGAVAYLVVGGRRDRRRRAGEAGPDSGGELAPAEGGERLEVGAVRGAELGMGEDGVERDEGGSQPPE
jgi:prolipoprotein diacylglyceryl transferase